MVRYGRIALLLAALTVLSLGLSALTGPARVKETDTVSVVAGFYPMYTAALQVAGDSDGVTVSCLTRPTSGCMHDYQLSPAERLVLERADLLLLNGAGAESFLELSLPALTATVVDTSAGLLLEEGHHEHDGHTHEVNEHVWTDPVLYEQQVRAVETALCTADPARAATYHANADRYCDRIRESAAALKAAAAALPFKDAVVFHDSLTYPAHTLGLTVCGTLCIGEEQGFSARDVAAVTDAIRGRNVLFLYDDQYPLQMTQLTDYTANSATVLFSTAVRPIANTADADTWLAAMAYNTEQLKKVTE